MTLDEFISLLQTADEQIDREAALELIEATDDLREYAQSIAHRQSGHMADSMYRLGPFPVGNGILEATIQSGAWYADIEVERGGSHDWASRTTDEQQARLQELADQIAGATVRVLTGST